ncbi:hypothetical protein AB6A40_008954 [Gnathostoma spinigerum]|uniref:Uncharacterized protein n=1 Tax=Gnathostoma spinigerum TaxID=75299 RepID=A0ABD6F0M9_9BILA
MSKTTELELTAADAAAQAAAYAQHQQLYLAHHQAAIQKEQQMRKAAGSSPQADVGRAAIHTAENKPSDDLDPAHMAEMMQHMAQVAQMMMGEQPSQGTYEGESTTYSQPSVQVTAHSAQQQNSPPQLWGGDRIDYGANDPLWKKWGPRAAPPYCKLYRPPPPDYQPTPGWLTIAQMKEQKLVFPSQVAMPPPPIVSRF